MPISYNYKTIYIHIPKCAGTSVERYLEMSTEEHLYSEKISLNYNFNLLQNNRDKFTDEEYRLCLSKNRQHYTYRELCKILPEETIQGFKKIAIVRNPYDRLVSEYYFCENTVKFHKDFETFAKTTLNLDTYTRNWLYDGHLETQTSYLINEEKNFKSIDKIFKFEKIDECLDYLKNITGIEKTYHLRKTPKRKHYEEYYTPELKEFVYNFYKDDFVNFNY